MTAPILFAHAGLSSRMRIIWPSAKWNQARNPSREPGLMSQNGI